MQANTDQERGSKRDRVAERGQAEEATAKPLVVDFETCQGEEKRDAKEAHDLDRRVDRNPAQHVRPEHDRGHDRGQPDSREEPERERRRQCRRDDG
jgi:hypothetical protein